MLHQSATEIEEDAHYIDLARHNRSEFKFLYLKYHKLIMSYVWRAIGDEQDAADITTDVFCKALEKIDVYQHRGLPFSAWLYKIAANEVHTYRRSKKTTINLSVDFDHIQELVDSRPENEMAWLNCLTKSLQTLEEEDFNLLQFRFFDDKSFQEIGIILSISADNAKTKSYRLLKKLKPLIQWCYAKV